MRIVLLGPPGSGKSVLAEKLSRKYKLPILNMHRLLSSMANEESELGRLVGELLLACAPIPEELVFTALKEPLAESINGFILEDFPRELVHAEMLHQLLAKLGAALELAIAIHVSNDDIMERLVGQLHCNACGTDYNIYSNPPLVEGVCDVCGGRISRRPADYEEGISNRLRVCEVNQGELIARYREEGILKEIKGLADRASAYQAACRLIDAAPRIPLLSAEELQLRAESAARTKSGKKRSAGGKRAAVKKAAAATSKKQAATKKTVVKKSSAVKKKAAAKKKVTKIQPATQKKAVTRKKAVTVKKAVAKKKATRKEGAVKKKVAAKKSAAKKTAAPRRAAAKQSTPKKKTSKKS